MDIKKTSKAEADNFHETANSDVKLENSEISERVWSCLKCGESNLSDSHYCRKCGAENGAFSSMKKGADYIEKKSRSGRWLAVVLLIIIIIGGAILGWYFWKQSYGKENARNYLINESKSFSNSVELINNLSTEKEFIYRDEENKEVFLKKMEEERDKSGKALMEIKIAKDENSEVFSSEIIAGTDALLKQYYQEAEEKVSTYNQYISYKCEVVKLDIAIDQEMDKIDVVFKNSNSIEDVGRSIREMQKIMDSFFNQYKNVIPPIGLEEAHNKDVLVLEKLVSSLDIVASGIEKKNLNEIKRGDEVLSEAVSDKNIGEIEQLRDYYFEELHSKFNDLRWKADKIKTEIIKSGAVLKAEVSDMNIEGW